MTGAVRAVAAAAVLAGTGASAVAAPTPVVSPYIDPGDGGVPRVGSPARGYAGVWSDVPSSVAYAWERCRASCEAIPGASGADYTPTAADGGVALRLRVTARYPSSASATAYSQESAPVAPAAPSEAPAPRSDQAAPAPPAPTPTPDGRAAPVPSPPAAAAPPSAVPASAGWLRMRTARRTGGYGRRIVVAGFVDQGAAGRTIDVIDPSGTLVGRARAAADGSFRTSAAAFLPGTWTARTGAATASFPVSVRPRVTLARVTRAVRRPGVVAVTGRIAPGVSGKFVELQYLDPRRGWRAWRRVRTGPGGRFRVARVLARTPGVDPFTLRLRVGVPVDVGWIFAPAVSPVRAVRAR
ncbi:MAG: hypothetical protein KDC33_02675 [Thermoleophilia bacterium]|nr:hypothetical protein [Thermoleophilia bacterium]